MRLIAAIGCSARRGLCSVALPLGLVRRARLRLATDPGRLAVRSAAVLVHMTGGWVHE